MYTLIEAGGQSGDLLYRALKNLSRLTDPEYRPATLEIEDARDWPGDRRGRALLGLELERRLTGLRSPYFAETLEDTLARIEAHGYMGTPMENGVADEQQLSGHNWLLRALLEIEPGDASGRVRAAAEKLVRSLYLPCAPLYKSYPHDAGLRDLEGKPSGVRLDSAVNGWLLSTDIGCAFMSLDGLSQYYQRFRDVDVKALLDEMVAAFFRLDPVGSQLQTHATLTATRGLMRLWEVTGEARLLARAEEIWRLYVESGMTENYANFNWFARPLWTEPCAVVDSYMLAMSLFRATEKQAYLEAAQRILYSALFASQRSNGGFGCDFCVQGETTALAVRPGTYEASWCCTMRGAEGLYQAARNAVLGKEARVLVTNYLSGQYAGDALALSLRANYPESGEIRIDVERCAEKSALGLYIPENIPTDGVQIRRDGETVRAEREERILWIKLRAPCRLSVILPMEVCRRPARLSRGAIYWRGPELLGVELAPEGVPADPVWSGERAYTYKGLKLFPASGGMLREKALLEKRRLQVVFGDEGA